MVTAFSNSSTCDHIITIDVQCNVRYCYNKFENLGFNF